MTDTQIRKLSRIKNYRTRYELTISNGEVTYLVCYAERNNRRGMIEILQKRYDRIAKLTGSDVAIDGTEGESGNWRIKWSGRTQRECILSGEHDFLGENGPETRSEKEAGTAV